MSDATFPGFAWEGFVPASSRILDQQHCLIELQADPTVRPSCSRCGRACQHIHDTQRRRVREANLFEFRVWLDVPVRRVRCQRCGVVRERLSWLPSHARFTVRLRRYAEQLLRLLPIRHVAQLTGLHWHTLKAIDKARLSRETPIPDLSRVRYLLMDEFALHKGHRYATVVMDAERRAVLWIGEGRSRESVRPFFIWLGEHCQHIDAVGMDQNSAMDLEVRAHCPNARIVYDLFHVVAKYGREVIDRVRVDQANRLRHDKPARRLVKQSRWLLLRNPENLDERQAVGLGELLAANQPLMLVYLMKAQLKTLWYARSERAARWRLTHWLNQALGSGVESLERFARNLRPYAEGIIASSRYPLSTSVLEGVNNRIKVIKRMAYGYRDVDYFFLKIRAAFPGHAR